jgi:Holliday junction resolvasome RuvABC endonuclease subunit
MLRLPGDPTPFRITGLDPGTDTLGVSTLDLDLATKAISIADSQTLLGSKLIRGNQRVADLYGGRFARLQALEGALGDYFQTMQPHEIISESPYFNSRRPQAYGALVEAMGMIQRAVYTYCSSIALLTVDPASNKANLKVSGKSGDKDLVKNAIHRLVDTGELLNPFGLLIGLLDEHSIDSLAVAYYRACYIRSQLL